MSWFGETSVVSGSAPREAVGEGVTLERRALLRLSVASVAAGLAACAASQGKAGAQAQRPVASAPDAELEFDAFLAALAPRARSFVGSGGEREEAYLMRVGELLARLRPPTPASAQATMADFASAQAPEFFEMWVVMFSLAPGKGFSHHDHRDYNGVILGVEGEAHVTNYDILGDTLVPPQGETFQIRQTRDDLILPGRFSTLGRTRENVHELVAGPDGATVLDVFTYMHPEAKSYFMQVDPEPLDAERRIYDAAWS